MRILSPKLELIQALFGRVALFLTRYSRRARVVFSFLAILIVLEIIITSLRFNPAATKVLKVDGERKQTSIYKERLYIAALHFNDENLLRKHWTPALLDLVSHWKPEDVYVSVGESGSWDGTKDALRDLDLELENLGIERNIQLSNRTHEDEVNREPETNEPGWIQTPRGKLELRRIHYLARERNKAMDKLKELAFRQHNPRGFDKVLWLNDIIFNVYYQMHFYEGLILTSLSADGPSCCTSQYERWQLRSCLLSGLPRSSQVSHLLRHICDPRPRWACRTHPILALVLSI